MASNYQSLAIICNPAYVTHFSVAYGNTTSLHMRQLFLVFISLASQITEEEIYCQDIGANTSFQ